MKQQQQKETKREIKSEVLSLNSEGKGEDDKKKR